MLDRYSLGDIVKCLGLSGIAEVREVVRSWSTQKTVPNILLEEAESGEMDFDIDLVRHFDVGDIRHCLS